MPGMVLCIEPTHADPALGDFHIEDTSVVTDGTPRLLSDGAHGCAPLQMTVDRARHMRV